MYPDLAGTSSTSRAFGNGDSREPFGPVHDPEKYVWEKDVDGEFDGGGFMVRFPMVATKIRYQLAELMHDRYIL